MGGLGDEEIVGFGRGNLAVWMIDDSTYSKRTEKANTTIAFNPSLMRRDQTNNSEMLKMNTSNAIAVISTPLHKLHCRNMEVSKISQASLSDSTCISYRIDALPSVRSAPRLWHLALECCGKEADQTSDNADAQTRESREKVRARRCQAYV